MVFEKTALLEKVISENSDFVAFGSLKGDKYFVSAIDKATSVMSDTVKHYCIVNNKQCSEQISLEKGASNTISIYSCAVNK
ncbi:Uncharacterised protein [Candidatus Tiddalikarchaeum anstoanum]|nr:Uncharacterised protein [Candidatus Tiddalikarchaeum anstoanum]